MDCSLTGTSVHGDSPGMNTGVGCHTLLQGIFPIQVLNPGCPHCRQIFFFFFFLTIWAKGNPRILEWVVYPFPRGSSQPKNWTGVSCITGRFFNCSTTKETCHQGGLNISSACLDIRQSFPNSRALTSFNPWGKITNLDKGKLTNTSDQPPP